MKQLLGQHTHTPNEMARERKTWKKIASDAETMERNRQTDEENS